MDLNALKTEVKWKKLKFWETAGETANWKAILIYPFFIRLI